MRHRLFALVLALGVLVPFSRGGPPDGPFWSDKRAPAGQDGAPGVTSFSQAFVAGKRACVIVVGDHKPIVDIEVKVFDTKNQLVAHDRGQDAAADLVAVIWYPARQETYRIEIGNYGKEYNDCSIAIK